MRNIPANLLAAYQSDSLIASDCIHIDLDVPMYITDNGFSVELLGETYLSNGVLLETENASISGELKGHDWRIVLTAVDSVAMAAITGGNYLNKWVYHYEVVFDEDYNIIGHMLVNAGQLLTHETEITKDSAELTLTISSPVGDGDKVACRRTNPASLKRHNPNEAGADFCHLVKDIIPWGKEGEAITTSNFNHREDVKWGGVEP